MTFLAPAYLWLGLLLIVPLILYLLPLPRRRVKTAALYLWERFLEKEPFGKASEKMRRALGFALLAAIFACLVLAAAEMAVGRGAVTARKLIVVMDVSASMNAVPADGGRSNLERAKAAAGQLIGSLGGTSDVTVIESGEQMRTIAAMGPPRAAMQRNIEAIEPFDGPGKLDRTLSQTYGIWGKEQGAEVYVFTDRAVPANPWGERAHAWIAPPAGDNVGIIDLAASRKNREIVVRFVLANYGKAARTLSGTLWANGEVRGTFSGVALESGQSVPQVIRIDEPAQAAIEVKIDGAGDALAADDAARAMAPSLEAMSAAVAWPDLTTAEGAKAESRKRNAYVSAVLAALQADGAVGSASDNATNAPATIFVNQLPAAWPKGGAIVLYPLKSGVIPVAGLHRETLTITHQEADPLLQDVDLRGLVVNGAVQVDVPAWARPLVWAGETPLVWAGETDGTKVLFVGIPVMPSGSRLPLVASFPVLLRNALKWMLPPVEVLRAGDAAAGWTWRRAEFAVNPADGRKHAYSVLSAEASDLRRTGGAASEAFASRRSLAMPLVLLAIALLAVEWGLFHRRLTE